MKAKQGSDAVLRYRCSKEHKQRIADHVAATPGDSLSDFMRRAVDSYLSAGEKADAVIEKLVKEGLVQKLLDGKDP